MAGDNVCDALLIRANLSALEVSIAHIIKRYTNVLFSYLLAVSILLTALVFLFSGKLVANSNAETYTV